MIPFPSVSSLDGLLQPLRADPALAGLVVLTALASFILVLWAIDARRARRAFQGLLGLALGGLAGLFTYTLGHVVATEPGMLDAEGFLRVSEEALRSGTLLELACVGMGAAVGFVVARYSWRVHGVASYIAIVSVVAGYVLHALMVALPRAPPASLPLSVALFAAEAASLLLVAAHSFYSLDFSVRKRWRRRPAEAPFSRYHQPKVAFHVATFNEPPGMVLATLRSLLALDYPADRVVVMVLDDSTDAELRAPVERFCREHGIVYRHRTDRRGYKAGALNEGLRLTPPDVDLVAVLDADYQVERTFLRETVGHFIDPTLGFLQTPQDYRNAGQSFLTRHYSSADAYFYRAVLPSRNEENAIIFCGTMGILRRSAVEEAGGWGEDYLTEDAELSVRILERGYRSLYVDRTYGRGLIPATFDAYRKQHHRWAYGSAQLLRGHARRLLAGRLSLRQKVDFIMGGLHWFDGVALLVIASLLAVLGVADAWGSPILTHHAGEVWLLALVPAFLLFDGLLRLHLALRRALRLPLTATFGVMGMWLSVKFSNAWGATKGLLGLRMGFTRTSKASSGRVTGWRAMTGAVRATPLESFMAIVLAGACAAVAGKIRFLVAAGLDASGARVLLCVWLLYYALVFAAAPFYAYKSLSTYRPLEEAELGSSAPRAPSALEEPAA